MKKHILEVLSVGPYGVQTDISYIGDPAGSVTIFSLCRPSITDEIARQKYARMQERARLLARALGVPYLFEER